MPELFVFTFAAVLPLLIVTLWVKTRKWLYLRFDGKGQPKRIDDDKPKEFELAYPAFLIEHVKANQHQQRFQISMVLAIGAVFTGFGLLSFALSFKVSSVPLKTSIYITDCLLLVLALVAFVKSRRISKKWLESRAVAECARQFLFVEALFLCDEDGAADRFQDRIRRLADQASSSKDIALFCRRSFEEVSSIIKQNEDIIETSASSKKQFYLRKRLSRQILWFSEAEKRLHALLSFRESLLASIFGIALLVAVLKVFYVVFDLGSDLPYYFEVLSLLSLISLGVTAAFAALIVNQSTQILRSRYAEQHEGLVRIEQSGKITRVMMETESSLSDELCFFLRQLNHQKTEFSL